MLFLQDLWERFGKKKKKKVENNQRDNKPIENA
jgi:hypothetical protein